MKFVDEFKDFKLKNEINVVVEDMNGEDISKIIEFPAIQKAEE